VVGVATFVSGSNGDHLLLYLTTIDVVTDKKIQPHAAPLAPDAQLAAWAYGAGSVSKTSSHSVEQKK
jgi:hypothetical protein